MRTRYATTNDGVTLQTSTAVKGSRHDFAIFKEVVPTFPENLPRDKGIALDKQVPKVPRVPKVPQVHSRQRLRGNGKIVSQQGPRVSRKQKPGKKLTPDEKEYHSTLARTRIRVEHEMRRVMAFRGMGDRYRDPRKNTRS